MVLQQQVCLGRDKKVKLLVAAIDIGTSFSCYAFSFKNVFEAVPTRIFMNQDWVAGSIAVTKVPTVVLFDEKKNFNSFGFEAEDTYADLTLDNKHLKWYFFKRFKMRLHGQKITRDIEIDDDRGRKMKAINIFGAVINYLKEHLLNKLKTSFSLLEYQDIHWVLTVPATWNDSEKQFMREAAYMADIDDGQLSLVTESEAASLFCQLIHKDKVHGSEDARFVLARPGTKYMIIDIGDETVDFTVFERQADGRLSELYVASVDALGGKKMDEEFDALLIRLIGRSVFQKFIDENKGDYLDFQRSLKTKKRTSTSGGQITITVPATLLDTYTKETKENIREATARSPYSGKISWLGSRMKIELQVFKNLFKPCTDKIVSKIKDILKQPGVQGTNIFLMVGDFSESPMLQKGIMKALPNGEVMIPVEAGLAVLKGAVIFGCGTVVISKYTYGINISPPFDPAIHPEDHRVFVGGINRCRDVFKKYEG